MLPETSCRADASRRRRCDAAAVDGELPERVLPLIVSAAVVDAAASVAELPERVLPLIVSVPSLSMPPPMPHSRGVAGEGAVADRQRPVLLTDAAAAVQTSELPERVLPLIVSVPVVVDAAAAWRRSCRRGCCR